MLLNNLKSTGVIGPFYERHPHRLSVPVLCVEVGFWISNCTEVRTEASGRETDRR